MKTQFEQFERHCLNIAVWGADGNQCQKYRRVGGNYISILKLCAICIVTFLINFSLTHSETRFESLFLGSALIKPFIINIFFISSKGARYFENLQIHAAPQHTTHMMRSAIHGTKTLLSLSGRFGTLM